MRLERLEDAKKDMMNAQYKNSFKLTAEVVEKEMKDELDKIQTSKRAEEVGSVGLIANKTSVLQERRGT